MPILRRLRLLVAAILPVLALLAGPAPAAEEGLSGGQLDALDATAERIARSLTGRLDFTALDTLRTEAVDGRDTAYAIGDTAANAMWPLQDQLDALGPVPEDGSESAPVAKARADLTDALIEHDERYKRAQLVAQRLDILANGIAKRQREEVARRLVAPSPSPLLPSTWTTALSEIASRFGQLFGPLPAEAAADRTLALTYAIVGLALINLVSAVLYGWAGRHALDIWRRFSDIRIVRLLLGLVAGLVSMLLPLALLFVLGFAVTSVLDVPERTPLADGVLTGLAFFGVCQAVARVYLSPRAPVLRVADIDSDVARTAMQMANGILVVLTADIIFATFGTPLRDLERGIVTPIAPSGLPVGDDEIIGLSGGWSPATNAVWVFVMLLAIMPIALALLRRLSAAATPPVDAAASEPAAAATVSRPLSAGDVLRFAARFVVIAGPIAAALGYTAAAMFVVNAAGQTAVALLLMAILNRGLCQLLALRFHGVDGRPRWWVPTLTFLLLAPVGLALIALAWGATVQDVLAAWERARAGVTLGDVTFSLGDLAFFGGVLVGGLILTSWLKSTLDAHVLPRSELDLGTRSSIVGGVGYAGIVLSLIAAVSSTSLDLSSLAVVAGALTVGIGFGLQTIVNNFISGLILLLERPVRVGDLIRVGVHEGHVRRIRVRSTEVETADRVKVIVPNSELILTTVTNLTHGDRLGRVVVPLQVATGSDPETVQTMLLTVARAHPGVLRHPSPNAFLKKASKDGLEFELSAIIVDVEQKARIASELTVAVLKAMDQAGIEFPNDPMELQMRIVERLATGQTRPAP